MKNKAVLEGLLFVVGEEGLTFEQIGKIFNVTHTTISKILNDRGIRVMTPREWGKLQGFINYAFLDEDGVDHFSFPPEVSPVQQYKQFGNSVTIPVIETMAEFMVNCFRVLGDIPNE